MAIARRKFVTPTPPAKKAERRSGRVGTRLINVEQKGSTGDFDPLLATKLVDVQSSSIITDPFVGAYAALAVGGQPIKPLYDFNLLANLVQKSNILRQCIESYVVNIESFGHTLEYIGPEGKEKGKEQQAERKRLESFLALPNAEQSLRVMRENSRWDQETYGAKAFEIIRNAAGEIVSMLHVPAFSLRMTRRDADPTMVTVEVPNPAAPDEMITKTLPRYFCRFIQLTASGMKRVYFKQFGDPRLISCKDGMVYDSLTEEDEATEILYVGLYTPGHIYGLPRWIGNVPSILGSRESEMVNLNFFRENAIPAMAVLISGGALTQESFDVIEAYISAIKGQKAMQRILVLEASADDTAGSIDHGPTAPKIDMKPMISERQQEGLFQDYDQKNQQKIRSAFRLPPIYAGRSEDYTRSSAQASILTAENQIFGPEREAFDDIMNNQILRTYNPKYWRFKSLGAPVTDPETVTMMMDSLESSGAMTPNIAIKIARRVLGIDIKPVIEAWGDEPFAAIMQYISNGREVEGLNEFLVAMQEAADTTDTSGAKPAAPGRGKGKKPDPLAASNAKIKKLVRLEMKTIAQEIQDAVVSSLQVPTSRAN